MKVAEGDGDGSVPAFHRSSSCDDCVLHGVCPGHRCTPRTVVQVMSGDDDEVFIPIGRLTRNSEAKGDMSPGSHLAASQNFLHQHVQTRFTS